MGRQGAYSDVAGWVEAMASLVLLREDPPEKLLTNFVWKTFLFIFLYSEGLVLGDKL